MTSEVLRDKKLSRDVVGLNLGTLAELITSYSQVRLTLLIEHFFSSQLMESVAAIEYQSFNFIILIYSHAE